MECPSEVRGRAAILYSNGFMGFQEPCEKGEDKDRFIILWTGEDLPESELGKIKMESKCETLVLGSWIGREYMSIHWTEYNKITDVLNTLLRLGYSFQTQTKGMPSFDSPEDKEFNFEILERKVIKQVKQLIEYRLINLVNDAHCEEWNYITKEGKEFANSLKNGVMSSRYNNTRTNFYEWEIFQNYDKTTLLSTTVSEPKKKEEEEEEEMCMICLDNAPNTMVLPCEHCVVCKECSLKLENTNNAMKCVKCRQDITFKLY